MGTQTKNLFYYYFLFFFSLMSASPELKRARKQENGEQNGSSAAQFTILVPDAVDAKAIELLKSKSEFKVIANGKLSQDELIKQIPDADAIVIRSGVKITKEVFDAAKKLKAVARAGVGVDNVDLKEATNKSVVVMNTPGGNTTSTAEHTFGLLLALARHIPRGDAMLRNGLWERSKLKGVELYGKTLGVVGFGRIGQAVAARARAFGMQIVAFDPFLPKHLFEEHYAKDATLDELYADADFITLHTVVTPETTGMFNKAAFDKMKAGVCIINAARGVLINEADLADALKNGKVAGAALDVFSSEPPTGNPLISLKNVVHTPHLAASTKEAQAACGYEAAEVIIQYLLKDTPKNVTNRDVLEKLKK